MKIAEILVGVAALGGEKPRTLAVKPHPRGLTIVPIEGGALPPEHLARALRETLSAPERSALCAEAPFLRISASSDDVELAIADDASLALRLLTETRKGGIPLILEAKPDGDDIDALLRRVALAAGADEPEALEAMLAHWDAGARDDADAPAASAEELAYAEAHRRAIALAKAVRAIDDRMTASVVPDWLWIATGLGGIGVFLTVIAFLYPDLRIYVVPALSAFALAGFFAYGWRSWRELKLRGELQLQRRELRARREAARSETRALHEALVRRGRSPEEVLLRHEGFRTLPAVPAIVSAPAELEATLARLEAHDRQTIVLVEAARVPSGVADRLIQPLKTLVQSL
jgi:hypothetical protein